MLEGEFRVSDVAQAIGLLTYDENDRKAIRRVLRSLVADGVLNKKGSTRAQVYFRGAKIHPADEVSDTINGFVGIPLLPSSKQLLRYLAQSVSVRTPIGYNQDFLLSYDPNKSFYLTKLQRKELHEIGRVDNTIRPAGTYARNILNRLLIDLAWNSSRLEGNTYSLLETKRLIERGESTEGKDASEAQMILNHKAAIEYIVESADESDISTHEVQSVHALLSENLLGDSAASGRIRHIPVAITGTSYVPLENPHLVVECFSTFIQKLNQIQDPFEQSFFCLVHISYLQAFEDVNKRTARLVANVPLIKKNLRPLSFTDVDSHAYVMSLLGVYEKNDISLLRDLYIWAYTRSSQRYSAIQQSMGAPNLLKMKYRTFIQETIRNLILDKVDDRQVVPRILGVVETLRLPEAEADPLFHLLETEIMNLHEGNIARFKIRPSEYQAWKHLQ